MYVDINYLELIKFNNCKDCIECCKNKLMAPLVLDDFKKVYEFFPILIAKLDYLKPVMLLSNGSSCPYLKNGLCTIYEQRPPACKIYPYSPWYDKILLDLSCKGIGTKGVLLPTNPDDFKNSAFYEERFENINEKLEETLIWTNKLKLNYIAKIHNIELFTIINNSKDKYISLQQASLNHLPKYNISL